MAEGGKLRAYQLQERMPVEWERAIVPEGIQGVVELLHIVNTHGHEGLGVESFSF